MSENGKVVPETMVRFERVLPGPIERVWEYLTKGELISQWFGHDAAHRFSIEPREGGAVRLADDHIRGVVTQWKPPRRLIYTWNVFDPGQAESDFPESYVSFELKPQGKDVLLILTHRPMLDEYTQRTMMGWHTMLERLGSLVAGQTPEPADVVRERNRARYGVAPFKR